jgi:peptide/nickel transport system ATP-binding protein
VSGPRPGGDGPLLRIEALRVEFPGKDGPTVAVDGVDLGVCAGEAVALVGESGSGKTTVARAVVRLAAPTAGTVAVDGIDVAAAEGADLRRLRRTVQMVFQDPSLSLDFRMSVGAIVAEPLAAMGLPEGDRGGRRAARRRAVAELLEDVGLPAATAEKRPAELSGGGRQRVAIARALAPSPRLLLLDEPVSSLDASIGAQVLGLLADLRARRGLAYLLISHDLAVVREAAGRVAVMEAGRIVEEGETEAVLSAPAHPRTRALRDAAQLLSAPPWG